MGLAHARRTDKYPFSLKMSRTGIVRMERKHEQGGLQALNLTRPEGLQTKKEMRCP